MPVPRIGIHTPSQGPRAKEARFTCETCKATMFVPIPWNALAIERQRLMQEAVDEHRYLCLVGLPSDMRKYQIHYPR